MFFILSKLLIFFTKPFLVLSTLLIISFVIKRKLWKKRLRVIVLVGFLIASNGVLIGELMRAWEVPAIRMDDLSDNYDVAIVLGGGADVDRKPADRLFLLKAADRITQAVQLYKAGKIKKILYTGANPKLFEDYDTNNDVVVKFYVDCGIPREDILVESESRNTHENAVFSAKLLDTSRKHILITSAFHMRRAMACFEKAGVDVVPFSCNFLSPKEEDRFEFSQFIPSTGAMENWEILIKEWIGVVAYKFSGYI